MRVFLLSILSFWVLSILSSIPRLRTRKFFLKAGNSASQSSEKTPYPDISVIIPVRNEEKNIGESIRSIMNSGITPLEILVVDDESSDRTCEIVYELSMSNPLIKCIKSKGLPHGWVGKNHALHLGASHARGDLFLFLDADVRIKDGALPSVIDRFQKDEVDLFSGFGDLSMETFWEKVIQPVVAGIIIAGNPLKRINDPKDKGSYLANGQFILVRRESYLHAGGHEAIKGEVIDDIALAKRFKESGKRIAMFHLQEQFSVRMYTNLNEIWHGWSKNLFPGMRNNRLFVLFTALFIFISTCLPFIFLPLMIFIPSLRPLLSITLFTCLLITGFRYFLDRFFGLKLSPIYALSHPLGCFMVSLMMLNSLYIYTFKKGVMWKERRVG